jgi:EmrB/QacA subfamily drug resistance transporter
MPRIPYQWRVLVVVVLGSITVILDTTVINVALPTIMNALGTNLDKAQLIISMYLLALALIVPTAGYLSDRLGTKRLYALSVTGFTLGSILCGLAWDIDSLIAFRFIKGLAGGITMPLGLAMMFRTVPRDQQGSMMGIFGIPILFAPIFGPVIGGYLVETSSWRMVFFINAPIGIAAIILTSLWLRETDRVEARKFDFKGFILAGVGFSAVLLALTRAPADGWGAPNVVVLFAVSAASLASWVYVELTEESPLLDLRIFRNGPFTMAASVYFIATMVLISVVFLVPLFLQDVRGLSPIETGLLLMPQGIALAAVMPLTGRLYDRVGPWPLIIPGILGAGFATLQLANMDLTTTDRELIIILMVRGVSSALMFVPAVTLTMSLVPRAELPRASALTNSLRQLFPAFGTAAFATILTTRQAFHFSSMSQTVTPDSLGAVRALSQLEQSAGAAPGMNGRASEAAVLMLDQMVHREAFINAFNDVFLIASIMVFVALIPAVFLRKGQPEEAAQPASDGGPAPEPAD